MKCNLGDVLYRSHDEATLNTVSNEWEVTMITSEIEREHINGRLVVRQGPSKYRCTNRLTGVTVNQHEDTMDDGDDSGWFWANQGPDDV